MLDYVRRSRMNSWPWLVAGLIVFTPSWARGQDVDKFDNPPPASLESLHQLTLYSTYYYVFSATGVEQGNKLLDKAGRDLGAALVTKDWCLAAVEGTVAIRLPALSTKTFNFSNADATPQVPCAPLFPSLKAATRDKIGKSRWGGVPADAQYGLGDLGQLRLVPFRSIAVDRSQPHFARQDGSGIKKTVIYVPGLKGAKLKMPDGTDREHDGYLFAADTGGAIKGNHIDFFTGITEKNPAPNVIKSKATATFPAYIVTDPALQEKLFKLHLRQ
jgi:3D (Asp-Asp-Asp) domain-containing protein